VFGGFRFFERKEIKDVLSYLKVISNPKDDESFLRSVACPKRGIGDKTLRELREFCSANGTSLYNGVFELNNSTISSAAKTKLYNYGVLLDSFRSYANSNKVADLIDYILETTGFLEQFAEKSEENTAKLYNISELKNSAEQFERDNPGSTLSDYLNSVTLSSDTDSINDDDNVTIATIHAVKGLEYKCVFVAGLDEKILPVARGFNSDEDMEEERRLMYVAVTRARERLYLTRAMSRYMYGNREYMTQSRFLKEAQHVLAPSISNQSDNRRERDYVRDTERKVMYNDADFEYKTAGGYTSNYAKAVLSGNKPKENKNVEYSKFKSGAKVKHTKFGEGTVICVKGSGDNIIVDVAFKGVGVKSLSAKFAPMEII
jgi:DNA helicase-2/ATP-dependent DNA helicase PcrA